MRILINFNDKKYEKHMITGLSEVIGTGFISNTINKNYDLIITDSCELIGTFKKGIFIYDSYEKIAYATDLEGDYTVLSINTPINEIVSTSFNLLGVRNSYDDTKVVNFSSPIGGSGVSLISYVFSRILFSDFEKRVLLISNYEEIFYGKLDKECRPVNELRYLIDMGMNFNIDEYIRKDDFGLCILISDVIDEKLVSNIINNSNFEYVVIDQISCIREELNFNKGELNYDGFKEATLNPIRINDAINQYGQKDESKGNIEYYTVLNSRDLRYYREKEKIKGRIISNFQPQNEVSDENIFIAYDDHAFNDRGEWFEVKNGTSLYTGVLELVINYLDRGNI